MVDPVMSDRDIYLKKINIGQGCSLRKWLHDRRVATHFSKTRVLKSMCLRSHSRARRKVWCEKGGGRALYGLGLAIRIIARSCVVPSGAGWESMLGSCLRLGLVQSDCAKQISAIHSSAWDRQEGKAP